jgi:hypothetical protein
VAFVLGQGRDRSHAIELAARYASLAQAQATLAAVERMWNDMLGAVQIRTPDDSFDLIVNRWLLYQTVTCRIWARSGPYQPGGAIGFAISSQDVLALMYARPDLCRAHLLHAASRQFVEGDRPALVAPTQRPAVPERDALTICCGCRTSSPAMCRTAAMSRCSTKSSASSRHRCSNPIRRTRYGLPGRPQKTGSVFETLDPRHRARDEIRCSTGFR